MEALIIRWRHHALRRHIWSALPVVNFPMVLGILESRERVSLEDLPEIGSAGRNGRNCKCTDKKISQSAHDSTQNNTLTD